MDLGKSAIAKQRYVKHTIAGDTCIKSHVYHYTIPYEMVICDSDGVTGNHIPLW
jgi:hypothetical protein